ncbi:pyridoxal phosphate-dependent aminotransferase [Paraburkholderia monticola]|nr:pyridoxal phosphate-dependent aminotransferase [Paraburkholderia monticola]
MIIGAPPWLAKRNCVGPFSGKLWLLWFAGRGYDACVAIECAAQNSPQPEGKTMNGLQQTWRGRFPRNEIISLLDVNRPFNLAESTSQDLTVGELLDLAGLERIRDLKLGYGTSAGSLALREAIAEGCGVSAEQIITTQGAALGLFLLAYEVCRPGDEAVLATPCFPPSRDCLLGAGVDVREVKLSFENGYRLELDPIAASLSSKTKLVSIASPQNPTGVQVSRTDIEKLLVLMETRSPRALLFVDETYREAAYGDEAVVDSFASLDARIVTGASVSKALGAPGLRTGWLTVADADLRARLAVAKLNTVISGSVLDETLATVLLRHRERVLAPRRRLLAGALQELALWCESERKRVEWVRPDAGALCCVRLRPDAFNDTAVSRFWDLLPGHDLQLACGTWFGESSRTFRVGFGYLPPGRLGPALTALSSALDAATE